jgi:hypothetical protein
MEKKEEEQQSSSKILSALHAPFFDRVAKGKNILISGCGGGYDFFSGLPLFFALKKAGANVFMGNLAFTSSEDIVADKISDFCYEVTADSKRNSKSK